MFSLIISTHFKNMKLSETVLALLLKYTYVVRLNHAIFEFALSEVWNVS